MIVALDYLCFAACVQVAAHELGGSEVDQVWFANQLGVCVSPTFDTSGLTAKGVTNIHRASDPHKWGVNPAGLPEALELAATKLTSEFQPISRFQDWEFEDRLIALCTERQFPVVGFDYNTLYGGLVNGDQGHCAVVSAYLREPGRITFEMHDPGPSRAGIVRVESYCLYRACRRKPGGLWILKPTG